MSNKSTKAAKHKASRLPPILLFSRGGAYSKSLAEQCNYALDFFLRRIAA